MHDVAGLVAGTERGWEITASEQLGSFKSSNSNRLPTSCCMGITPALLCHAFNACPNMQDVSSHPNQIPAVVISSPTGFVIANSHCLHADCRFHPSRSHDIRSFSTISDGLYDMESFGLSFLSKWPATDKPCLCPRARLWTDADIQMGLCLCCIPPRITPRVLYVTKI